MNARLVPFALAAWLALTTVTWADTVKTARASFIGHITKMTALEVVIEQNGVLKQVPVNEVVSVYYEKEPALLMTVRTAIANGQYENAQTILEKIVVSNLKRSEILQDVAFYKAFCAAQLALAGDGDIKQAGGQMNTFVEKNPTSHHFLEACEIVGDLLVADHNYSAAQTYYDYLAKAPWPDYKMRAGVAIGRAQLASGKPADAQKTYEAVLAIQAQGEAADTYRLTATLGKARCLTIGDKSDEAIRLIQDVIDRANPEDMTLQAEAYNALGIAQRKAGKNQEALLAFLHVDVLYFSSKTHHIEALQNLNELWKQMGMPRRAAEATQTLRERYKVSPRN